jgi:protein SCO1
VKRTIGLTVVVAAVVVALVVAGSLIWSKVAARSQASQLDGDAIRVAWPAPQAALIDQDGRPYRVADQQGKEVVLFFGYAHCPDICPTTLARLVQAKRLLGSAAHDVEVAFITVDPERDTVATLKRYVGLFDPHFYGLTGSHAALDAFYSAYHVWHQKLPNHGSAAGYLMAHSSSIYMLDRNGNLRVIHDWNDKPAALAHDMKAVLQ